MLSAAERHGSRRASWKTSPMRGSGPSIDEPSSWAVPLPGTPDSVLLDIPGQKGHVVLARASIADVAVSAGRESRLATIMRTIPLTLPVIVATSLVATTGAPDHGPHHVALRNQRLALVGMEALLLGRIFNRTPAEKWREVAHW